MRHGTGSKGYYTALLAVEVSRHLDGILDRATNSAALGFATQIQLSTVDAGFFEHHSSFTVRPNARSYSEGRLGGKIRLYDSKSFALQSKGRFSTSPQALRGGGTARDPECW